MEQAQELLKLYKQVEKHIRYLAENIISEEENDD